MYDGRELQDVGGDQEAVSVMYRNGRPARGPPRGPVGGASEALPARPGLLDSLESRAYHDSVKVCRNRDPRNDNSVLTQSIDHQALISSHPLKTWYRRTSGGRWCTNERGSCAT
jgi:hypothetical protein